MRTSSPPTSSSALGTPDDTDFDVFELQSDDLILAVQDAEQKDAARAPEKPKPKPAQAAASGGGKAAEPSPPSVAEASNDPLALERKTMETAWFARMEPAMRQPTFVKLKSFLDAERKAGQTIYPPAELVHNWSRTTPLERVKVVIVGQDPYHQPGQACGHSFSVPRGKAVPPSLQNIYKELANEYEGFKAPTHGCLDGWAKQGVLLLNACLVRMDERRGC